MTPAGPRPIELNQRLGGAEAPLSVKLAYGVSLVQQMVRICLGEPVRDGLVQDTL